MGPQSQALVTQLPFGMCTTWWYGAFGPLAVFTMADGPIAQTRTQLPNADRPENSFFFWFQQLMIRYCGKNFSKNDLAFIRQLISENPSATRAELSRLTCRAFKWIPPCTFRNFCGKRPLCRHLLQGCQLGSGWSNQRQRETWPCWKDQRANQGIIALPA